MEFDPRPEEREQSLAATVIERGAALRPSGEEGPLGVAFALVVVAVGVLRFPGVERAVVHRGGAVEPDVGLRAARSRRSISPTSEAAATRWPSSRSRGRSSAAKDS